MNVTIYGDSILKGVLMEDGKYVVDRGWEQQISKRFGLEVRNRSRFGCTIRKALDTIRRDCAQSNAPGGITLLELGGNDCDYDWKAVSEAPDAEHLCKTPPELFRERYREAVALVRQSGRKPVLLTLPPIHSERYLGFICRDGLSRGNILHWLGDVEAISRWQEGYSRMVEKLAQETNATLIDLRSAFQSAAQTLEQLLCIDGIHPSRMGQNVIRDTLCDSARRYLTAEA